MTEQTPAPRSKVLDAWDVIRAKLEQRRVTTVSTKPFIEYAWQDFDVREVTSILSSPEKSYFGHKDILFAGLCAWTACPKKPALMRHATTLALARLLDAAERAGRAKYKNIGQLGDNYVRTIGIGSEFFEDIYYPIGGLRQIAKSPSPGGFKGMLRKNSDGIEDAIMLMSIFHHHLSYLSDRKQYGEPSVIRASQLIFLIAPRKRRRGRRVQSYWAKFKDSAAFAYAASRIMVSDESSLLDEILMGRATFKKYNHLIPEWFGRAKFAAEEILGNCAETKTAKCALKLLPAVGAIPIEPPMFDQNQRTSIEAKFRKKRASGPMPT